MQELWEKYERGEIDQAQYTDKMSKYYVQIQERKFINEISI